MKKNKRKLYKNTNKFAFKEAGKLGGNKKQMSNNYNRIKKGKEGINYNEKKHNDKTLNFIKQFIYSFKKTPNKNYINHTNNKKSNYSHQNTINEKNELKKYEKRGKSFEYIGNINRKIKKTAIKVVGDLILEFSSYTLMGEITTIYKFAKLMILFQDIIVHMNVTIDNINYVAKVFIVKNGVLEATQEKFKAIVEAVKNTKKLYEKLIELSKLSMDNVAS